ncbi:glycosyl hydrolase, partial [Candidatus Hydrogenedentota bacterium]
MNGKLLKEFKNPSNKYRGKPFWAWNGKLEPEELRRQIRVMDQMGLGGFFMHSRVGLGTPYLSDEWFECVDACIDEAEKLNMEAWMYDEDRWPSGAAGGLVTKNPEYRMRFLRMEEADDLDALRWTGDVLAVFTARVKGNEATRVKRIARKERPERLKRWEKLLIFRVEIMENNSWYNGYTYLDTMDDEAVAEFIRVTHEEYRKRCGKHFGKRIPGMFTDEPNVQTVESFQMDNAFPWTRQMLEKFEERYGYDLLDHLPEIYFNVDGQPMTPARLDYRDCLTHLFVENFSKQISDWCEKNKLLHTGHVLWEELLSSCTRASGSAMRFLMHM